ncbi:hypothetical protein ACTFIZ_002643 [Dictyostelium cf. discoideum]
MSKAKTIISLVLLIIAFGFATAAFPFYWYEMNLKGNTFSFGVNGYLYSFGDTIEYHTYSDENRSYYKNLLTIIRACLAFDVLAWALYLVGIVLLIVKLTGKCKDSSAFKLIGKIVMVPATGFILLSVFILLATPSANKKDCIEFYGESICENGNFDFISENQNPGISWVFVIISAAFSITTMILNFCGAF